MDVRVALSATNWYHVLMRLISFRELRNSPAKVQALLEDGDLTLTAKGKPVALLVPVNEESIDQVRQSLFRIRTQLALTKLRRQAVESGADRLTEGAIGKEINQVRRKRKVRQATGGRRAG